ncbi:hypothetical protein [uncultured Shewanella sp.]|uniref:tetratricopeptide repeat protein n=1 Tax=uncultured Shewanella sp. TaxID=173975 RepID=UPI00261C242B|nr:hypothetical protein [uncultured Shewanella sp.]
MSQWSRRGVLLLCFSVFTYSSSLLAHGTSISRLEQLQHELSHHPNDANLYIARGRLYQERHEMHLAFEDYQRAAKLKPHWPDVQYWLGLLYLEQEKYSLALTSLNQYTVRSNAAKGHAVLARLYAQQKAFRLSANAWNEAIVKDGNPSPAMYHERALALMKMQTLPYSSALLAEIVMGLEAGMAQHGPIASYLTLLVDIYERNQLYQKALMTLERLPSNLLKSPKWKVKKAKMLALAGEQEKAIKVYQEALMALDILPRDKQALSINKVMKKQVIKAISGIGQRVGWPD